MAFTVMLKTKKPFQINDLEWFDLMLAETVVSISDPAGARTQDPILKRDVLYLLSY